MKQTLFALGIKVSEIPVVSFSATGRRHGMVTIYRWTLTDVDAVKDSYDPRNEVSSCSSSVVWRRGKRKVSACRLVSGMMLGSRSRSHAVRFLGYVYG